MQILIKEFKITATIVAYDVATDTEYTRDFCNSGEEDKDIPEFLLEDFIEKSIAIDYLNETDRNKAKAKFILDNNAYEEMCNELIVLKIKDKDLIQFAKESLRITQKHLSQP